jgi:hypothetical protein
MSITTETSLTAPFEGAAEEKEWPEDILQGHITYYFTINDEIDGWLKKESDQSEPLDDQEIRSLYYCVRDRSEQGAILLEAIAEAIQAGHRLPHPREKLVAFAAGLVVDRVKDAEFTRALHRDCGLDLNY